MGACQAIRTGSDLPLTIISGELSAQKNRSNHTPAPTSIIRVFNVFTVCSQETRQLKLAKSQYVVIEQFNLPAIHRPPVA